ncbi:MAG: transcription antitermination factor NusB [Candidatus Sumerlaeia bacterium]
MTSIRHLARQRAMQLLYALEFAAVASEDDYVATERRFLAADPTHKRGWGPFARELARRSYDGRAGLDDTIGPMLHNWKLERLPILDRVCLRMALCELRDFPDIPLRVTINEYIELVRQFSSDEATQYINAVLDRLAHQFPEKDFKTGKGSEEEKPKTPRRPKPEPKPEPKIKPRIDPHTMKDEAKES